MEEQRVREAIRMLIKQREQRIHKLEQENKATQESKQPVRFRVFKEDIARLEHGIDTLIELEHNLRLCDCPDEAYTEN
jgi:Arc/MetJ-type ribon-helix-helix transcriptional regulator